MNQPLKILVKYASRGRKDRFFNSLDSLYHNFADGENFRCAITLDSDDEIMNDPEVILRIQSTYPNHILTFGKSESKVHAINRDMPDWDWDICICWADDMICTFYGFDQVVRSCFKEGLDWLIHLPEIDEGEKLAVLYIAGRTFFDRFGHIYPPIYKSLFCDTELMAVAKLLGRYKYFNYQGLYIHMLPAYGRNEKDAMWLAQQEIGWTEDFETFKQRQEINFGL